MLSVSGSGHALHNGLNDVGAGGLQFRCALLVVNAGFNVSNLTLYTVNFDTVLIAVPVTSTVLEYSFIRFGFRT